MSLKEKEANYKIITTVNSLSGQVFVRNPQANPGDTPKTFAFDVVFDTDSKQVSNGVLTCNRVVLGYFLLKKYNYSNLNLIGD